MDEEKLLKFPEVQRRMISGTINMLTIISLIERLTILIKKRFYAIF